MASSLAEPAILPGILPAPCNQWYVAAFSAEVGRQPLARRILGVPLVLYRTGSGDPVALTDRCAHRAMMLSKGVLKGDAIQCPYHGIEYGPAGQCVHVPSQRTVNGDMKIRAYPIMERGPWLWVWMGDSVLADPARIPGYDSLGLETDPGASATYPFALEFKANYAIVHENLLDVSHVSFLHEGLLDTGVIARLPPRFATQGNTVTVSREGEEVARGDFARIFALRDGERVKRTIHSKSWAPSIVVVTHLFEALDDADAPLRRVVLVLPVTPATDRSCHHFGIQYRDYGPPLPQLVKAEDDAVLGADRMATEAIQRTYDELGPETPDFSVAADRAGLHFRHIVRRMFAAEQKVPA